MKNPHGNDVFNDWCIPKNIIFNNLDSIKLEKIINTYRTDVVKGMKENDIKIEWSNTYGPAWTIEPDQAGSEKLEDEKGNVFRNFATSYSNIKKMQVIDFEEYGFDGEMYKNFKVDIEVGEYYSGRWDCSSIYYLDVYLVDNKFNLVDSFSFNDTLNDNQWHLVNHTFKYNHDKNPVRYVIFVHTGKVSLNLQLKKLDFT